MNWARNMPGAWDPAFGARLRLLRDVHGRTDEEMAAALGIPLRRYRAHEAGRWPRRWLDFAHDVRTVTGAHLAWIVYGERAPERKAERPIAAAE